MYAPRSPLLLIFVLFVSVGCETENEACADVSCSFRGQCAIAQEEAICACDDGYHAVGLSCVRDGETGPCSDVLCSSHGVCAEIDGQAECRCDAGFVASDLRCILESDSATPDASLDGSSLDAAADPCQDQACDGHGSCIASGGDAACVCDEGYVAATGLSCRAQFNTYLVAVDIPTYDRMNTTHFLIETDADWAHINDADKQHFFVAPGDYTSSIKILTRSGTDDSRRTLSLHNGNDSHPGILSPNTSALMNVRLRLDGASYWTLDRISTFNLGTGHDGAIFLREGATHNVIHRYYGNAIVGGITISDACHDNTVQRSRFEDMEQSDAVGVQLGFYGHDHLQIMNTHIVDNEFYNQNDGVQLVRSPTSSMGDPDRCGGRIYQSANYEGTVVDGNRFYIDDDTAPTTENAIDLKVGSANSANPTIISNNIMWGYTGEGNRGRTAAVIHNNTRNVIWTGNIAFDSVEGLRAGSSGCPVMGDSLRWGLKDSVVTDNTFFQCNGRTPVQLGVINVQMEGNVIIDSGPGFATFGYCDADSTFQDNDICNTPNDWTDRGGNSAAFLSTLSNNRHHPDAASAGYTEDFVFVRDRFTPNPVEIRLTNLVRP